MMARHLQYLNSDKPIERGRPKSVKSDLERRLIQFCLSRQKDKSPVTIEAAIEFIAENGTQIDKSWVNHFGKRNTDVLKIHTAKFEFLKAHY
jgi:hypothetical protein